MKFRLPHLSTIAVMLWVMTAHLMAASAAEPVKRSHNPAFVPNQGQLVMNNGEEAPQVAYYARGKAFTVYFREGGISYIFSKAPKTPANQKLLPTLTGATRFSNPEPSNDSAFRLDMNFTGASDDVALEGGQAIGARRSFYYPHCPDGVTDVPGYQTLTYQNVYPGIDIRFYFNKGQLKYDIEVQAEASPEDLRFQFEPESRIQLSRSSGGLQVATPWDTLHETIPEAYQPYGKKTKPVACQYQIRNKGQVALKVGPGYQEDQALTIDPLLLSWSTLNGGSVCDVALDDQNNVYLNGRVGAFTNATFNPTPGAFQTKQQGDADAFLSKFDAEGNRIWATYYGGGAGGIRFSPESGKGVAVRNGLVAFTGVTENGDFPVSANAYQPSIGGRSQGSNNRNREDAFLVVFDTAGNRNWATFLGGDSTDVGKDVAIAKHGKIALTGEASSSNFPVTSTAINKIYSCSQCSYAFLSVFDTAGGLSYSTYLGGRRDDIGNGVDFNDKGDVAVGGFTGSPNFRTLNGYQNSINGRTDAFASVFNRNFRLKFSTLIGGNSSSRFARNDIISAVKLVGNNIYFGGSSVEDFPTTANAFQAKNPSVGTFSGGRASVLGSINLSGQLNWSTFISGTDNNRIKDIAYQKGKGLYFFGTSSNNFPVTPEAFQKTTGTNIGTVFGKFSPLGTYLYGSYFAGGSFQEQGIAVSDSGDVYLGGQSNTFSRFRQFPFLKNAYKRDSGSGFTSKFSECLVDSLSANSLKAGRSCRIDSATFRADSGYTSYRWYRPGSNTKLDSNREASFSAEGEYILRATTPSGCVGYDTVFVIKDSGALDSPIIPATQTLADSAIRVVWRPGVSRSIFNQYDLYRKREQQNQFQRIDRLSNYSDTIYTDSTVSGADQFPYNYYVTADTRCGDSAFRSNRLTSLVLDTVSITADSITLSWNPPSDTFSGAYNLINAPGANGQTLATVSDTLVTVDRCRSSGQNEVAYTRQNAQASSNERSLVPTPAVELKKVTVLDSQRTRLAWKPAPNLSLAYGYVVERKTKGGSFQVIDTVLGKKDSFYIDTFSTSLTQSQCYRVKGLDSCSRNTAVFADTHCTMLLSADTISCEPVVALNWNAYRGYDSISQYELYRETGTGGRSLIATLKPNTTRYRDTVPNNRVTYSYEVVAVSAKQGYRSTSDQESVSVFQPNIPLVRSASKRTSSQSSGQVEVSWNNQQGNPKLDFQRLYYKGPGSNRFNLLADSLALSRDSFIHTNLNTQSADHRYYVVTVDSCGNESDSAGIHKTMDLQARKGNLRNTLSWTPYQGFAVQEYEVQRSTKGGPFRTIAAPDGGDTSLIDSNIRCGLDYRYQIVARGDSAKQVSVSDAVQKTGQDTIPPDRPDLRRASVVTTDSAQGQVALAFNGASQDNRKGYIISRKQGASFQTLDTLFSTAQTNLTDTAKALNTAGTSQTFYIQATDSCGNVSMPRDTHRTMALNATPNNAYVQLTWSAYKGWNDRIYRVQRRQGNSPWQTLETLDSSQLRYRDSSVKCRQVYDYRIAGEALASGYRALSNTDTAKGFEQIPPAPPSIRRASVAQTGKDSGTVSLTWKASVSADAAQYLIYRKQGDWNYQFVDTVTGRRYQDSALNTYDRAYDYRLKAVDSCDNVSDSFSTPHRTLNLKASGGEEAVILNWNAYEGRSVLAYQILRGGEVLTTLDGEQTRLRDEQVICDTFYNYRVRGILDGDTTIRAFSNYDSAKATDNTAPQPVYLQRASVAAFNDVVEVKWEASEAYDARSYQVFRRNESTGGLNLVGTVRHPQTTLRDSVTIGNREICYVVRVKDACRNSSGFSNQGCIIQPEGQAQDLKNALNWPPYRQWQQGVQAYQVFYQQPDSTYKRLASLDSSRKRFLDETLNDTADQFCYYIRAQGFGEETYSRSTRVCLAQSAVVYIPNTFSPGVTPETNDQFGPDGLYIRNYEMQIYNRWGEQVFSTNKGEPWDGTVRGELVQPGIYHYRMVITGEGGKRQRYEGHLNVIR